MGCSGGYRITAEAGHAKLFYIELGSRLARIGQRIQLIHGGVERPVPSGQA